jgi:hypothetical protein
VQLGGTPTLPDWLPAYPGAQTIESVGAASGQAKTAGYAFNTNDSAAKVASFYEDALKKAGLEVQRTASPDGGIVLNATDSHRTVEIKAARSGEGATTVGIFFENKK